MKITFYGATHTVTGSCFLIETKGKRILVECGLFQGKRALARERNSTFLFDPESINLMLLSHAHIDHSGNIPTLIKKGYKGDILTTFATVDLLKSMLPDSAHIQEKDAEYVNKKHKKKNLPPIEPLYTMDDAQAAIPHLKGIPYRHRIEIFPDIFVTFYDAGHILGSAQILIETEGKRLLFTGDLGRSRLPIIKDPEKIANVDFMIMESTYGNRYHKPIDHSIKELEEVILRTYNRGGKVIIPSFAVGRTQEIVYDLHKLFDRGRLPAIPIYVDSPLSVNVTEVFRNHPECYDEETLDMITHHEDPFGFYRLKYIKDVEQSKMLNYVKEPCIIISASGMAEAGRILHHLKNNIENPNNTILIVGYQAEHTLGRRLVERRPKVKIFGEEYELRAEVVVMNEYSAHADRNDLLRKVEETHPRSIALVHGEDSQMDPLFDTIKSMGYNDVYKPDRGETLEW